MNKSSGEGKKKEITDQEFLEMMRESKKTRIEFAIKAHQYLQGVYDRWPLGRHSVGPELLNHAMETLKEL